MQNGSYFIRNDVIYVQGYVDGRQYRLSTKKRATPLNIKWIERNHRDVLLNLLNRDRPIKNLDFEKFAYDVLESGSAKRDINTQNDYISALTKHILPTFKHYRFADIKPLDIEKWQNRLLLRLSPSRSKLCRLTLRMILKKAVANEIIHKDPFEYVDPIKVPKRPREPYTEDEMNRIINQADGWFKAFILTAFGTGARTGELMALKWSDIDFENNTIKIRRRIKRGVVKETTKTKTHREIEMLKPVRDILLWHYPQRQSDEWLFVTKNGTPYRGTNTIVDNHFKPILESLGIRYRTLYSTRHTFMTMMINNDMNLKWVQEMSGIKTASVLLGNYTHFQKLKGDKLKIANNLIA